MQPFKKLKQFALRSAGASWHQHVAKDEKRIANRVIRRELKKEVDEFAENA